MFLRLCFLDVWRKKVIDNTIFYNRLKEQAAIKKKSLNRIERDLKYPRNSLHNYKTGTDPSGIRLVELADYFMISPHYLIGKSKVVKVKSLVETFQTLSFEQKIEIYEMCEKWATSELSEINNKKNT